MSKNIVVFGLGKTGASIAMALKARGKDCRVIGADPEKSVEDEAIKKGLVNAAARNIHDAAAEADLVILALSVNRTRETLESLGQVLKPETVVLDCCPDKSAAAAWAQQSMVHPENYLGIWPEINPIFLFEPSEKIPDASSDLFRDALMQVGCNAETSESAIRAASELAAVLGMGISFIDPLELDGMLAGTQQLPLLLGSGLIHTCTNRPGWTDAEKTAGKYFASVASVLEEASDAENSAAMLMNNRKNDIRLLDELMDTLGMYRESLKSGDEDALRLLLEKDREDYLRWINVYRKPNRSDTEQTNAANVFSQAFLGGFLRKKKEK